jgi:dynein heavy chain
MALQEQSDRNTLEQVEKLKDTYLVTATRVSRLFFVLIQVMNVNFMYQYSLKYFKGILEMALMAGSKRDDLKSKEKRKAFFRDKFTELLYTNICRSLFEVDKLLFSFLMCLKIKDEDTQPVKLDAKEVNFLLMGITKVKTDEPNPTGEGGWITPKTWCGFL